MQSSPEDVKNDPAKLKYSKSAEALTQSFEGCKLAAYQDSGGVWTIGYGHTGPDVVPGMVISSESALILLDRDLTKASQCVGKLITVPLTQNEFDALVDFVFNLGCGTFYLSTMRKLLNRKEYQSAGLEFSKWDHASGKVLAGLLRRRQAEEKTFNAV